MNDDAPATGVDHGLTPASGATPAPSAAAVPSATPAPGAAAVPSAAVGPRGLYAAKGWYTARLTVFVRYAVRTEISPDVFTLIGIAGGLLAAALLALSAGRPNPLWAVPVLLALAVRLAGANLDGAVARARNVSRPWGFVLNEIGDRAGDLAVMLVLADLALPARHGGGWWALIGLAGSALPTFASLSLAGAGGPRLNGGPLGKTERCAIVVLTVLLAGWVTLYALACAVIGLGGLLTAALRLRAGAGARAIAGAGADAGPDPVTGTATSAEDVG